MNTNFEMEYKFLVDKIPDNYNYKYFISQTYLHLADILEFAKQKFQSINFRNIDVCRVRFVKSEHIDYFLTLKSNGLFIRNEYECEISEDEAKLILKNEHKGTIKKERYVFYYNNLTFEFDKYIDRNLITSEVEVQNKNTSKYEIYNILKYYFKLKFKDITFDEKYKNSNLALSEE